MRFIVFNVFTVIISSQRHFSADALHQRHFSHLEYYKWQTSHNLVKRIRELDGNFPHTILNEFSANA